jgi:hypothetical protein
MTTRATTIGFVSHEVYGLTKREESFLYTHDRLRVVIEEIHLNAEEARERRVVQTYSNGAGTTA